MYKNNQAKIVITIEARMTSIRLPGKVLLPLAGKPALELLIERLKKSKYVDEIVVATTTNSTDDCLEELTGRLGIGCFRGSEEDVLGRVLAAAKSKNANVIVEITGDNPFIDHHLVDRGIEEFFENNVDYASNTINSTYPIGFAVQVFWTRVLDEVEKLTQDPIDRTHVSYYIYKHPEKYKLHNWEAEKECNHPEFRVTLDEEDDYELLKVIAENFLPQNEKFSVREVVDFLQKNPRLAEINKNVRQKSPQEL